MATGNPPRRNHSRRSQSRLESKETIKTPSGLKVTVCLCDITGLSGDAIVTGEGEDMNGKSKVSQLLLKLGGCEYEKKRKDIIVKNKHKSLKEGSIYDQQVDWKKLNHKYVLHAIVPKYGKSDWKTIMGKLYDNVMKVAERLKLKKITMPLLGSGKARAPLDEAALIAVEHLFKHPKCVVEEINLVTLDQMAFTYLQSNCDQFTSKSSQQQNSTASTITGKKTGSGSGANSGARSGAKPDAGDRANSGAGGGAKSGARSGAKPDAGGGANYGAGGGVKSGARSGAKSSARSGAKPDAGGRAKPASTSGEKPGAGGGTKQGAGNGAKTGAGNGAKPGAGGGIKPGAGNGANTGAGGGTNTGVGNGAKTGVGNGAKTGAGNGTKTGVGNRANEGQERGAKSKTQPDARVGSLKSENDIHGGKARKDTEPRKEDQYDPSRYADGTDNSANSHRAPGGQSQHSSTHQSKCEEIGEQGKGTANKNSKTKSGKRPASLTSNEYEETETTSSKKTKTVNAGDPATTEDSQDKGHESESGGDKLKTKNDTKNDNLSSRSSLELDSVTKSSVNDKNNHGSKLSEASEAINDSGTDEGMVKNNAARERRRTATSAKDSQLNRNKQVQNKQEAAADVGGVKTERMGADRDDEYHGDADDHVNQQNGHGGDGNDNDVADVNQQNGRGRGGDGNDDDVADVNQQNGHGGDVNDDDVVNVNQQNGRGGDGNDDDGIDKANDDHDDDADIVYSEAENDSGTLNQTAHKGSKLQINSKDNKSNLQNAVNGNNSKVQKGDVRLEEVNSNLKNDGAKAKENNSKSPNGGTGCTEATTKEDGKHNSKPHPKENKESVRKNNTDQKTKETLYHDNRNRLKDGKEKQKATSEDSTKEMCVICMEEIKNPKKLDKCGHVFCRSCITDCFEKFKPVCPTCNMVYGVVLGTQPEGTMTVTHNSASLPGYPACGMIIIDYVFHDGMQTEEHPKPGSSYHGTRRTAFLPDNREGKTICKLLRVAFERRLVFTIGRSSTTGREDVVTWNDIHHKTRIDGGPTRFGYPDPDYLRRVREELTSKGVTEIISYTHALENLV